MAGGTAFDRSHIIVALVTVLVSQGGAFLVASLQTESALEEVDLNREDSLRMEVDALRDRLDLKDLQMDDLRLRIATLESANLRLKLDLATKTGNPKANMRRLLDDLPFPAWAKEVVLIEGDETEPEDVEFMMIGINTHYELEYCITDPKYRGKTDFEVHAPELARVFWENDSEIFYNRSSGRYKEIVYDCAAGVTAPKQFYKVHHQMTDGTHVILGLQVSE